MAGIIAGIVIALITAIISAYINRRSKTGKINTSEAKDLWDTLRSELARLQKETTDLRAEMAVAREEMSALRLETATTRADVVDTNKRLISCLEHSKFLEEQLRLDIQDKPVNKDVKKRSTTKEVIT